MASQVKPAFFYLSPGYQNLSRINTMWFMYSALKDAGCKASYLFQRFYRQTIYDSWVRYWLKARLDKEIV